jgi:hypothetical protein
MLPKDARATTYPLLEIRELARGEGISLANDWDNVDSGAQTLHQLDIDLPQAISNKQRNGRREQRGGGRPFNVA